MDALRQLWESTANFQQRFGLDKQFDLDAQRRCVAEEHWEFQDAVSDASGFERYSEHSYEGATAEYYNNAITNEAADVIVTVLGVLMGLKMSYADIEDAIERISLKNDAKTHDTHAINENGKVARKQVVS